MVKNKKSQLNAGISGSTPHFKSPFEITLFMYLVYRRDNPANIASAFVKAEKEGIWTYEAWGYNGLKIQQNISTALLDMQDRDILTSVQDECQEKKRASSKQRKTPFKKCHYYSINPNWITNTMHEEYRQEANKNVTLVLGLLKTCAPSKMEVIGYQNRSITKNPRLMEQSSFGFQMAIDSLNRLKSHLENDHIQDPIAEYEGYMDGWPPMEVSKIQSAIDETGFNAENLSPIISDTIETLRVFAK